MKSIILFFCLVMSFNLFAQEDIRKVHEDNGVIVTCDRESYGCSPKIAFADEVYVLYLDSLPKVLREKLFETEKVEWIDIKNLEGHVESLPLALAPADDNQFVLYTKDMNAVVTLPEEGTLGGAPKIIVNGEKTIIDQATLPSEIRSINKTEIPVSVKGYYMSEDGHFPNPTVEFKVFKIVEISLNDVAEVEKSDVRNNLRRTYKKQNEKRSFKLRNSKNDSVGM